jgi:hypothetical protein
VLNLTKKQQHFLDAWFDQMRDREITRNSKLGIHMYKHRCQHFVVLLTYLHKSVGIKIVSTSDFSQGQ